MKLMFVETWFGGGNAGGANRGLVKIFAGIRADRRNKIVLTFASR